MLGVLVLAVLFVATWATTSARLTNAKKNPPSVTTRASVPKIALSPLMSPAQGDDNILNSFEVEGDITDNPAGAPDDWSTVNCGGGTAQVQTFLNDGLGTSIFTQGGSKDPSDIGVLNQQGVLQPGWRHTNGAVPDKDEILNAYAAKYTGTPNGDTILAFGADRYGRQGDSSFR